MNIYQKTINDAGLSANAPTVGTKLAFALCTVLNALEQPSQTGTSATQDFLNRVAALGLPTNSTAYRAMAFDLSHIIAAQQK